MAKRKTSTSEKSSSHRKGNQKEQQTFINKDVFLKAIVGMLLLIIAGFLFVTLLSYSIHWKSDQSILPRPSEWQDFFQFNNNQFHTPASPSGALVADFLLMQCFGLGSFFIPLFLGVWGFKLLFRKKFISTLRSFFFSSLLCIVVSIISAHYFAINRSTFPGGGRFGLHIHQLISDRLGPVATTMLFSSLILLASLPLLIAFFRLSIWKYLISNIQHLLHRSARNLNPKTDAVDHATPAEMHTTLQQSTDITEDSNPTSSIVVPDDFWENTSSAQQDILTTPISAEEIAEDTILETLTLDTNPNLEVSISTQNITPSETESTPEENAYNIELDTTSIPLIPSADLSDDLTLEVVKHDIIDDEEVAPRTSVATEDPYDPALDLSNYKYPIIDLLEKRSTEDISIDKTELENNKNQIINTLKSFGIAIAKISATVGPTVTLYEIVPAEGVRISKIRNLEDDIALSLSALGIRIIAPIPGKGTIGIEVPNIKKQIVSMRTLISSDKFIHNDHSLPIALGKRIDNENYIVDLAKMPHLLMAGATGQGKSVGINTILVSLLYKKHPSQLKFVLVDPKKVELSIYRLIEKHFLAKLPNEEEAIITDTKKVINTLNALCIEMDNRYDLLKDAGVRNIKEYNEKFVKRKLLPTKGHKYLPFIVLVVDEFADLIMTAGKEVELPIARIAQLARAVGIHCIVATQRPSVNVITGTIKANFPARIAFKVSAKVDSRTILDAGGAEQLIGQGDMLILNGGELVRLQCAFVDTPEVERIVDYIGDQQGYPTAFELPEYEGSDGGELTVNSGKSLREIDQMFEQCARLVVNSGSGSTSMLQRRFNLGYNRAGRIMDQLEAAGIVGASIGGKPREVLMHTEAELDTFLQQLNNR